MTLVVDRRSQLQNQAGLHAFVVGVSSYRHLQGGEAPAPNTLGMGQLSSPTLSAAKLCEWLMHPDTSLAVPLATCRVLLSPAPQSGVLAGVDAATLSNFLAEAAEWRTDVSARPKNVSLFYFAGHGVARNNDDAVMLLHDFAAPGGGGLLRNAVEIANLSEGMSPSDLRPNIARTQFYFVDACRARPDQLNSFQSLRAPVVFDLEAGGVDDRCAPIYLATMSATLAAGRVGRLTVFGDALLRCLKGAAAEEPTAAAAGEPTAVDRYRVSVNSLNEALEKQMARLNRAYGTDQEHMMGGRLPRNETVCFVNAPEAEIYLEVDPGAACQTCELKVVRLDDDPDNDREVASVPAPLARPYIAEFPMGLYELSLNFPQPFPPYYARRRRVRVKPPGISCRIGVV